MTQSRSRRRRDDYREPFGPRIARFFALIGCVAAIAAVAVLSQILHPQTITLILGIVIGLVVLSIPVVAIGWFYIALKTRPERHAQAQQPQQVIPQIVIPAIPQQQQYQNQYSQQPSQSRRSFEIVGIEED